MAWAFLFAHWTVTVIDRIDANLKTYQSALNVRARRQELLASNIANADTPHYKAKDLDFSAALRNAMGGGKDVGSVTLARTAAGHLPGAPTGGRFGDAEKFRTDYQPSVDGNTVNMDIERAAFAENALHVEALLTFIRSRFSGLQTAMQSQ